MRPARLFRFGGGRRFENNAVPTVITPENQISGSFFAET